MKQYGLIGFPLGHSFSKGYFSEKFARENIRDAQYENYPLQSLDKLGDLLRDHPFLEGLNVTIPHKVSVITYLDALHQEAREIGAVNCIRIRDHKMTGFNTDHTGFAQSLAPLLRPFHQKALILGTGGSSKAVAYALRKMGLEFLFVSRKKQFHRIITYDEVDESLLRDFLVIINTTPVGMFPDISSSPDLPYHYLTNRHILFDLIYNPEETIFLKQGRTHGSICHNGAEMLAMQAEASWKIWNEGNLP